MLVYGKNILKELDKKKIRKVYCSRKEYEPFLQEQKIHYEFTNNNILDKMVNGLHQGIVIDMFDYEYKDLNDVEGDLVVMLDHIEDPHNLGSIIRTCACAGVKSIIIPKDRSAKVNDTVVKVSEGTLSRVDIIMVTNLNNAIETLKKKGYYIYASEMNGEDYRTLDFSGKNVLIIGNEGSGVSELVKKNSDFLVSIKMHSNVDSLNAGVAAGILIFGMKE
jgi:23S rRNA (guanosine2251-2'-O)-methyltransferase